MSELGGEVKSDLLAAGDYNKQDDDARSQAGSERSTASSRSGIPKPSGIKPPSSKIGRPCAGSGAKPALPTAVTIPAKNSSYDYVRKVSEEMSRYKLSDVLETEEYEEDFFGNRLHTLPPRGRSRISSNDRELTIENPFKLNIPPIRRTRCSSIGSTATTSSMDALWELHPRRLSEAGLSRHSDTSAVLTEDTDSFIIGQRVFVGGTKPGQIAYIGETQFAPGEWAGIVLDQPIGKNDGSVGGVRYFQCESKRGVFSRLTRLTRYPLEGPSGDYCPSPSPTNGTRRSPVSPAHSTRSALSMSNTSIASTLVDFRVGDRVIIKSSQGSKIGTLRYMGFTSFANGEWCGVELDEPRGKNDGCVEGKRYFECRQNFGLFAPITKVSKSPSNRKPGGNCVVHSGMRKGTSRESLASMSSSMTSATTAARRVRLGVTSLTPKKSTTPPKSASTPMPTRTALQDVLKEKQQHIEQLLKERDLERAEITRAASQAEEAEQKYATLQQEFEKYQLDSEVKFKDYSGTLEQMKAELNETINQLEDERKKTEDLQFKFEEAAITKGDIEVANEENLAKMQELKMQLEQYRSQNEADATNLNAILDELAKNKEENASLRVELEHANGKRNSLEYEEAKSIEMVQALQSQLEAANDALKLSQEDSLKQIDILTTQISKQTSEFEVTTFKYTKEMEDFRTKYTADLGAKDEDNKNLKAELADARTQFETTSKELEVLKYEAGASESALRKEIEKLKAEFVAKTAECEAQIETANSQTKMIQKLETELKTTKEELEKSRLEIVNTGGILKENENVLRKEIEDVKGVLAIKDGELEKARNRLLVVENEMAALLTAKLKGEESLVQTGDVLKSLQSELENKTNEAANLAERVKEIESNLGTTQTELTKTLNKCDELTQRVQQEGELLTKSKDNISALELQIGDYQRKLLTGEENQAELTKQKQNLQLEIEKLCSSSGEDSAKLETLNQKIRDKDAEIETLRSESAQKIQTAEHAAQELEITLQNNARKAEKEVEDLRKVIAELEAAQSAVNASKEEVDSDKKLLSDKLFETLQEVSHKETAIQSLNSELKKLESSKSELLEQNKNLALQIESVNSERVKDQTEYEKKIHSSSDEFKTLQGEFDAQKTNHAEIIDKIKDDYGVKLNAAQLEIEDKNNAINKLQCDFDAIKSESDSKQQLLTEKLGEIEVLNSRIVQISGNCEGTEKEMSRLLQVNAQEAAKIKTELEEEIKEKNSEMEKLHIVLDITQTQLESSVEANTEKDRTIAELSSELQRIKESQENTQVSATKQQEQLQNAIASQTDFTKNLQSELDKVRSDFEIQNKLVTEKSATIEGLSKDLETMRAKSENDASLQAKIDALISNVKESESAKKIIEIEKQNCLQLLSMLRVTEEQKDTLLSKAKNELLTMVLDLKLVERDEAKELIQDLQHKVNSTNDELLKANEVVRKQQTDIQNLQNELVKTQTVTKQEIVPKEAESIINNNAVSNNYKQLLEEKLFAESQVQFLNSIIVDMQKKNEEQKARIEILESGYSPAAADELNLMGYGQKQVAPRMYCDICEEFDLHETEDCPLQAAEDLPAPPRNEKDKTKAPPRPYCEICEMFGHLTEDCQDDQTF